MEILTEKEFWARNPAPGTRFASLSGQAEVVAREIDPETDEPDDIVAVTIPTNKVEEEESFIVLSWGSWDDNKNILDLHKKASDLMKIEEGPDHVCELGLE